MALKIEEVGLEPRNVGGGGDLEVGTVSKQILSHNQLCLPPDLIPLSPGLTF